MFLPSVKEFFSACVHLDRNLNDDAKRAFIIAPEILANPGDADPFESALVDRMSMPEAAAKEIEKQNLTAIDKRQTEAADDVLKAKKQLEDRGSKIAEFKERRDEMDRIISELEAPLETMELDLMAKTEAYEQVGKDREQEQRLVKARESVFSVPRDKRILAIANEECAQHVINANKEFYHMADTGIGTFSYDRMTKSFQLLENGGYASSPMFVHNYEKNMPLYYQKRYPKHDANKKPRPLSIYPRVNKEGNTKETVEDRRIRLARTVGAVVPDYLVEGSRLSLSSPVIGTKRRLEQDATPTANRRRTNSSHAEAAGPSSLDSEKEMEELAKTCLQSPAFMRKLLSLQAEHEQ